MEALEQRLWWFRALRALISDAVGRYVAPGASMLDVGCGTGGTLLRLSHDHPSMNLQGLDVSPDACDRARRVTGATVTEGSAMDMPFPDRAFDAVIGADVLNQGTVDPTRALREVARVLKPGGILITNDPAYAWLASYHDGPTGVARRYTRAEMAALVETGGFTPLAGTYWNTLTFPLMVLRRKVFVPRSPTTDVHAIPFLLNALFNAMMAAERMVIRLGVPLPFGGSVFLIAQKNG